MHSILLLKVCGCYLTDFPSLWLSMVNHIFRLSLIIMFVKVLWLTKDKIFCGCSGIANAKPAAGHSSMHVVRAFGSDPITNKSEREIKAEASNARVSSKDLLMRVCGGTLVGDVCSEGGGKGSSLGIDYCVLHGAQRQG